MEFSCDIFSKVKEVYLKSFRVSHRYTCEEFYYLFIFNILINKLISSLFYLLQQLFSSIIVYNSRTYAKSSFVIFEFRDQRDRGCFASSKQQRGDVLEILFSTTVSLTSGYSTFRSCIVHAEYVWRKDRENGNGPRFTS